ncbi:uncharacterized protein BDCG_16997 [Blastomyces dermatitidis ER-3]|uniref:Uncharacterized protein n=1 Tax=Ajellomyces dermatitidis (strain ER-3 / ATCC MYA-2586) TaxID=559297 RepID=A0ABX2VVR1_AJEDR|nr:uncharacterized protein BDCG_16997 [Blastomyces dermatitidis ER-3]OAT01245.1 hypothetical protein BDCG_16997 [Blastomyces dermatitidis ER-3]
MISHFYNKHYYSAHTRQFISKSSCVDRSASANDSELNVKSLIENLKNVIIKKLSVSCVTESFMFLSASSAAAFQSSTPVSVSGSPTSATSVPVTLTSATSAPSDFTVSAFVICSPCFQEMLCRLNESCLSRITSLLNSVEIVKKIIISFAVYKVIIFTDIKKLFMTVKFNIMKNIYVFRSENTDVVLFYTCGHETFALMSEIILIKDDNTAETILFYS